MSPAWSNSFANLSQASINFTGSVVLAFEVQISIIKFLKLLAN